MSEQILHIENLCIGYKKPIVDTINLNANEKKLICIIGRNGTGKSTLLNTLSGVTKALSGNIFYNKKNFAKLSLRGRSTMISYVPSKQEYLSNLSVYELVALGRSPYTNIFDKKSIEDKQLIEKNLAEFDLTKLQNKALYEISDGERQRSMICRAIVQQTPIILLDEPTAFLDYYAKQKLLSDLAKLAEENSKCIIFSSHDIELSLRYAQIVWLFDNNKITAMPVEELKKTKLLEKLMNFRF
ncbi:ABC transporter ATP-binding protein [Bacteroidales bacterium OttesenSCG-928-I21]|nr:ABC transporter ATP-binding protein [Bacteroidales bacterium OttesenSCG-928-I21]